MWKLNPNSEPTKRNVQAAILQAPGAVTTFAVVCNYRFLRKRDFKFRAAHFVDAANTLQEMGLGTVVGAGKTGGVKVFIKNPVSEVIDILKANPGLCSPEYYEKRYKHPLSKAVSLSIRSQLAEAKLVPKRLLM